MLTAGELLEKLKEVNPDTPIRFQWIEDEYIQGRDESFNFKGADFQNTVAGWKTYDLPCDEGCEYLDKEVAGNPVCASCHYRNRYINASRCFIHDGNIYIDGHY